MKLSLKWLNEYVDVPADTKALCDKLYKEHPIAGKRAMETFLFENFRI